MVMLGEQTGLQVLWLGKVCSFFFYMVIGLRLSYQYCWWLIRDCNVSIDVCPALGKDVASSSVVKAFKTASTPGLVTLTCSRPPQILSNDQLLEFLHCYA